MSLKEAAKRNGIKFVLHCNGKVMVRKEELHRVHIISSVADLKVILGSYAASTLHMGLSNGDSLMRSQDVNKLMPRGFQSDSKSLGITNECNVNSVTAIKPGFLNATSLKRHM